MSTSNNLLYKGMSTTSAKVVWTSLVPGGEPRQDEHIKGCNPPLIYEASCWRLSRMILNWLLGIKINFKIFEILKALLMLNE